MRACAFTSVCADDAGWLPQYLAEAARLRLPFVMHLDRCSVAPAVRSLVESSPLCVGVTAWDGPGEFDETHKQAALDAVVALGYDRAVAWDVDETYERDAPRLLAEAYALDADHVDVRWLNLWGDPGTVRTDGSFGEGHRVKILNLRTCRWRFRSKVVNGPTAVGADGEPAPTPPRLARHPLVCLHWGMMTAALRRAHKARWDRIYAAAVGSNPYKFWEHALDPAVTPRLEPNVWGVPR